MAEQNPPHRADDGTLDLDDAAGHDVDDGVDRDVIERVALGASPEGQQIAAGFVALFGRFIRDDVRPLLRDVAAAGGEPQLLVNGLAELLREVAADIEAPVERSA